MPPALEVITIVVSMLLSSAARMTRFEIHWGIGGRARIFSQRSRVVCSSSSFGTRWLSRPHS